MRKFLLHLNFSLALAMLVLVYCDNRNPMMGFLSCPLGYSYLFAFSGLTVLNGMINLFRPRKKRKVNPKTKAAGTFAVDTPAFPRSKMAGEDSIRENKKSTDQSRRAEERMFTPQSVSRESHSSSEFDNLMSEIDELLK